VTSNELYVPVDRQLDVTLTSLDVVHSFFVPEWRIKKDNVPGITTQAVITPTRLGSYQLICTELCGFGHATMRAFVHVVPQADFDRWLAQQAKAPAGGASTTGGAS
jgi:cytochrome c oxidase subunit 2